VTPLRGGTAPTPIAHVSCGIALFTEGRKIKATSKKNSKNINLMINFDANLHLFLVKFQELNNIYLGEKDHYMRLLTT
jgi:hypothetical protein